jgi:hypothetical protein
MQFNTAPLNLQFCDHVIFYCSLCILIFIKINHSCIFLLQLRRNCSRTCGFAAQKYIFAALPQNKDRKMHLTTIIKSFIVELI